MVLWEVHQTRFLDFSFGVKTGALLPRQQQHKGQQDVTKVQ